MNIIEALNSGRKLRRKSWGWTDKWIEPNNQSIFADDWEIQPVKKSVTITREQFDAAWDNALLIIGTRLDRDALAKELGL